MKLSRYEVYELINGERAYQNALPPSRTDGSEKTVGDYLTMLRSYMAKADAAWTDNNGNYPALDVVRKIAGIAVHCMEDHGAPPRAMPSRPTRTGLAPGEVLDIGQANNDAREELDTLRGCQ